jgi:hypothetical protein
LVWLATCLPAAWCWCFDLFRWTLHCNFFIVFQNKLSFLSLWKYVQIVDYYKDMQFRSKGNSPGIPPRVSHC